MRCFLLRVENCGLSALRPCLFSWWSFWLHKGVWEFARGRMASIRPFYKLVVSQLRRLGVYPNLHVCLKTWLWLLLLSLLRLLALTENILFLRMLETRLFINVRIWAVGLTINEILIRQVVLDFKCVLQITSTPLPLTLVLEWQRKVVVILLAAFQIILLSLTDEWVLSILLLDLRTNWLPYRAVVFWQSTLGFVWWFLAWILV